MTKSIREVFVIIFAPIILMMLVLYFFRGEKDLEVGINPDHPPFEFIKDDNIEGFDVDLIKRLVCKLDKRAKISKVKFSTFAHVLYSGQVDMAISAFSKDSKKAKDIKLFSVPYYTTSFTVITKKEGNVNSLEDLPENSKIGVQTGSIMEKFINKFNTENQASIDVVSNASNADLIEKLKIGEIDGMIVEKAEVSSLIKNAPEFVHFSVPESTKGYERQGYVIGFRKDSDLIEKINKEIEEMKSSGEMDYLLKKWGLAN